MNEICMGAMDGAAYISMALSYECKMFIKSAPGSSCVGSRAPRSRSPGDAQSP